MNLTSVSSPLSRSCEPGWRIAALPLFVGFVDSGLNWGCIGSGVSPSWPTVATGSGLNCPGTGRPARAGRHCPPAGLPRGAPSGPGGRSHVGTDRFRRKLLGCDRLQLAIVLIPFDPLAQLLCRLPDRVSQPSQQCPQTALLTHVGRIPEVPAHKTQLVYKWLLV